ncbi:tat pathway signal sequence [Nocardia brasiliensis]|uniref:Tat pathway signal sequence n=1 Tax=Nocardia brasiliensis TaxID=37326 RepID=A0A6G9XX28_NOCBR|nr:tat pathway signal sequence [Nocardia brasiliensis]QIS05475.1 tat pathway signal sequence [Nocardia brasiliensis]
MTSGVLIVASVFAAALLYDPPQPERPAPPSPPDIGAPLGFDPAFTARIAQAEAYVAQRPGFTAIVVRDRRTGAVWRNADAATPISACSTPKLAMVVDLLLRADAGTVTLSADDRELMHRMLHSSDNDAATTLWERYGGERVFAPRFRSFGMTEFSFSPGHPDSWGWMMVTANDLERLMNYALENLPARDRAYLVREMRSVDGSDSEDTNQQWGVWGAGADALPGNKNGWADDNDDGSWLMNSVGFVGPREQFTVAIMNNTRVIENGYQVGRKTVTKVGEILFKDYFPPPPAAAGPADAYGR